MMSRLKENKFVILIIILTILFSLVFNKYFMKDYSRIDNSTISYVTAKVTNILSSQMEYDKDLDINIGHQVVEVEFLDGTRKGEKQEVENAVTAVHNVELKIGTKVIINADEPNDIEPYYTIYQYDRSLGMFAFVFLLCLAIVVIGKGKGIKSIIGLLYSLYLIMFVLLPMVFSGYPPLLTTIVVVILSTLVTLLLLNGHSKKTYSAIASTVCGVLISALCFFFMSIILHVNGFSDGEAERELVLI